MSFPRYPKYKDSGVEWLGDVPEHWTVKALKRGFAVSLGKMLQPEPRGEEDELFPYLRAANIQWGGADISDVKQMWFSKRERVQLHLEKGDLLVSEGGDVGRTSIWLTEIENCYFQNSINRIRARDGHSNRYLYYWISTIKDKGYIDILCNKSTIAHFTAEKVAEVPVPLLPYDEQQSIANFLDREMTQIDALIEKKQRLIELLKEKRTALISQAVTKGLDPNAKMKDSGVKWLGNVPDGWEVKKLKYLFRNLDYKRIPLSSEERSDREKIYPYYGASGVIDAVDEYLFDEPTILVAEDGANLLSRSTSLAFIAEGKYWVNNHAHIIQPISGPLRYWEGVLQTFDYTPLISGSAQPKLTSDNLGSIPLPYPSLFEQQAIENYIANETTKIDGLIEKVETAIDKLKEYRTAFISAAVTGKIDVRKYNSREVTEDAI